MLRLSPGAQLGLCAAQEPQGPSGGIGPGKCVGWVDEFEEGGGGGLR